MLKHADNGENIMHTTARECLCLALDRTDRETIKSLADMLREEIGSFKLNSAFVRYGPELVSELQQSGIRVFLDLKFHDIPATVAEHVRAAADLGVDWLTVHASGGRAMMRAAAESAHACTGKGSRPRILAVTVLTSLNRQMMNDELRIKGPVHKQVMHLADEAIQCGMDGIVCSGADLTALRCGLPPEVFIATPGISGLRTPAGYDQQRVTDPVSAIRAGASMLIVGRAVLAAADPLKTAREIRESIADEIHGPRTNAPTV